MGKSSRTAQFSLEGRFLGFVAEGYKLKLMRLATATGDYTIKLPKELRPLLYRSLTPGEWVQVSGYQKLDGGRVKLKAEQVMPIAVRASRAALPQLHALPDSASQPSGDLQPSRSDAGVLQVPSTAKPDTILVCQKSDCCKRGGNALVQALQNELAERGLSDQVKIRGTGCMKRCKAGPNLIMPDKTRYTRIQAPEVPALLDQHFPASTEVAS